MWKRLIACLLPFVLWQLWGVPFRLDWLAFPVGAACGVALWVVAFVAEQEWGRTTWLAKLRSPRLSCGLLALTVCASVVGGCGWTAIFTSWPFVALVALLLAQLTLLMVHRAARFSWRRDTCFFLLHGGFWLALLSGSVGAADASELRVVVKSDAAETQAYDTEGRLHGLPYRLQLEEFQVETHASEGTPVQYTATLLLDEHPIRLAVNAPYAVSWCEDLYLMSYQANPASGRVESCLLMLVREPWKNSLLLGILLLLAGVGVLLFKLK